MVFFNYATMQMAAKIVYYGPGLCGKTTNLQYIYQKTSPKSRGEMVSLETETDRTLFFDLLPLDVGNIAGFRTRFQLYTVPGQVFYNSTRKLVLRGVDGIVFVADSQTPMFEANLESLKNLKENLDELGLSLNELPLVFQFNKRDLKNISKSEDLTKALNPRNLPFYEASAKEGWGIFETLKGISKATLITLRKKALGEEKPRIPETARTGERPRTGTPVPGMRTQPLTSPAPSHLTPAPVQAPIQAARPERTATPSPAPIAAKPATPAVPPAPIGAPVTVPPLLVQGSEPQKAPPQADGMPRIPAIITPANAPTSPGIRPPSARPPASLLPTAAEIAREKVEFAEITSLTTRPQVKKIAVKSSDIGSKLDALREMYTGKAATAPKKSAGGPLDSLTMLLESARSKEKKVSKKLKIRLDETEFEAVKSLLVDFHVVGENNLHKRFSNAVTVTLEGSNPKRMTLKIELEILKK